MKPEPLPKYQSIKLEQIPSASTLLFYHGNWVTEWFANKINKYPYKPAAFHAAFYIEDGLFLNVGAFKTVQEVRSEYISTRRIDVVIYKNLGDLRRQAICRSAYLDTSKPKVGLSLPDYSWRDYLRFGLRFLKPSKRDFCSENVVELFSGGAVTISDKKAVDTAPWDLHLYATKHGNECDIRTLWTGLEFKG